MKKNAIGFYFNVLAAILGIAGLVCTVLSSSGDNALSGLSTVIAAGVVAIALVIVAIYSPMKNGNHDPIAAVSVIAAIALFMYVFNQCVSQRVMLIAGLFSFNANNAAGWTVFSFVVGAAVCLLAANILLVIGSFCKSAK